ncbi:MAG: SAM-dependent methyltransferase [Candidatus Paceibacterota bacterium]|jgi:23S rRNA (cytosine1962-C5)-methyltransferase
MLTPTNWKDYELIDSGDGMKLERWGKYVLARPDPQTLWQKERPELWNTAVGVYTRSTSGGGSWRFTKELPERWKISYKLEGEAFLMPKASPSSLSFWVRPTDFKHTGLFPEQAVNWGWLRDTIGARSLELGVGAEKISVLNLFAYTGAATVACASAGARVTHVDASKGVVTWARENLELNQASPLTPPRKGRETLKNPPSPSERGQGGEVSVRWIVDDVFKFVEREAKRGVKYDGIIMDPPSYGRGTKGETWKIEKMLWPLVKECVTVLSDKPLFFLINSYTSGLPATVMSNLLESAMKGKGGSVHSEELGLKGSATGRILPAGVTARWQQKSS